MKKLFVVGIILILLAGAVAPASAGILQDIIEFFFPSSFSESPENNESIENITLFEVGGIIQQSNEPITIYGNGWKKTTYPDGRIQYTYGVKTYFKYDNVWRPWSELEVGTEQYPYFVTEDATNNFFTADGKTITIPKAHTTFRLTPNKISPTLVYSKAVLQNKMIYYNTTVNYLVFPYSLSQVKDYADNHSIKLGRFHFKAGKNHIRIHDDNETVNYLNSSAYQFKIVNDEIRLYFVKSEANKLQGNIFFEMHSWTLSGAIGSAWTNVEHDNTTSVISTGDVELRKEVDDYISYWRFDENTGITEWDENTTSNNTGTWSGSASANYTAGKYGYGLDFDGTNDYVNCGNDNSLKIAPSNHTIEFWVNISSLSTTQGIFAPSTSTSDDTDYGIWIYSNDLQYLRGSGATREWAAMSPDPPTGELVHCAVVISADALQWYLNGVKRGSDTLLLTPTTTNNDRLIGSITTSNYQFAGAIDDVSIYNRALSNDEINTTMDNEHYIEGNLSSTPSKDAGAAYVWQDVSLNASLPANTNASIYVNTSADNSSFTGWQLVQSNAAGDGTKYTIPAAYQKRYGHWRLYLKGNVSQTPEIENGTFHSGTAAAPGAAPVITLLSQSPSSLYENSTGYFNVSYGITHVAAGLNNTSVSFIYTNYDTTDGSYNHSVRPPANNRTAIWNPFGEKILRADNRNGTLNFEDNATITGGNVYEWGGGDENVSRMTIVPIDNTYTKVYWNGTIQDTVSSSMWYLDRTDIQDAAKTQYAIYKNHGLLTKIWDIEALETHNGYILNVWVDSHLGALTPNKPVHLWYLNESYDPTGAIDPTDSPYAFYVTSHNATMWTDYEYSPQISTYVNAFYVNQTTIETGGVVMTNKSWIYLESETASSKPYYVNTTNAASTTNRTFAETNVTYSGEAAPLTLIAYTANIFAEFKHDGHQYQMKLYAADNNGNWSNSTLSTTNIGDVNFPPTYPGFGWFWYNNAEDYDMDGTYQETFDMIIGVGTDPDGGNTTHNLTLHYANETYVATINNTFNASDATGGIINITIDSSLYYICEDYTLKVTATDDSGLFSESWLGSTFQLHASAPNITTWYNNVTSDTNTSFTVNQSECVYFNATANQTITTWTWKLNGTDQSHNFDNISLCFDSIGIHTVKVYGTNANCSSQTITWTVTVEEDLTLSYLYALYLSIIKENEMLAQVWLFLILLLIAFAFLAVGYLSINGTFKIFGAAFSSLLFILLAYAVIGNQFGEMLQMAWLATLLVALGLIQAIYTLLVVISVLYMMFVSRQQSGMSNIPFDPRDGVW